MSKNDAKIKISPHRNKYANCIATVTVGTSSYQMMEEMCIDTGASYTVVSAQKFGKLTEQQLIDAGCEVKILTGVSDFKHEENKGVKFHKLQLKGFSLAGMDFGSVPIYVTFEEGYRHSLLGCDLLDLLDYSIDNSKYTMTMKKTERFLRFQQEGVPLTNPELLMLGEELDEQGVLPALFNGEFDGEGDSPELDAPGEDRGVSDSNDPEEERE